MASRFGKLLKSHREELGLNQRELARELGAQGYGDYKSAAVSRWEAGTRKPPIDVIESLEDIYGLSRGVLLQAAGYGSLTHQGEVGQKGDEQQAQDTRIVQLARQFKIEVKDLSLAHGPVEPPLKRMAAPGLYDLWLEGKLGTVCYKYERNSDGQVVIHCPVEYEPGFAFLRKLLHKARVWQHYGEWQEMAKLLVLRIGDRTARSYNRDQPRLSPVPGREMPVQDVRVQLNRLAVTLEQGIDKALAEIGGPAGAWL